MARHTQTHGAHAGQATSPPSSSSLSEQAAQALQVLDTNFGPSACLYFLSQLQPAASSSSSSEPPGLTKAQVCWPAIGRLRALLLAGQALVQFGRALLLLVLFGPSRALLADCLGSPTPVCILRLIYPPSSPAPPPLPGGSQ